MKFIQKNGWLFLVILIIGSAFFRPPSVYTFSLSAYGVNQLFKAVNASNGIPGEERVQLLQVMQEQIIQQDKDFAHADSLRNLKHDSTKKK